MQLDQVNNMQVTILCLSVFLTKVDYNMRAQFDEQTKRRRWDWVTSFILQWLAVQLHFINYFREQARAGGSNTGLKKQTKQKRSGWTVSSSLYVPSSFSLPFTQIFDLYISILQLFNITGWPFKMLFMCSVVPTPFEFLNSYANHHHISLLL